MEKVISQRIRLTVKKKTNKRTKIKFKNRPILKFSDESQRLSETPGAAVHHRSTELFPIPIRQSASGKNSASARESRAFQSPAEFIGERRALVTTPAMTRVSKQKEKRERKIYISRNEVVKDEDIYRATRKRKKEIKGQ